jgi:hypothetical protein
VPGSQNCSGTSAPFSAKTSSISTAATRISAKSPSGRAGTFTARSAMFSVPVTP